MELPYKITPKKPYFYSKTAEQKTDLSKNDKYRIRVWIRVSDKLLFRWLPSGYPTKDGRRFASFVEAFDFLCDFLRDFNHRESIEQADIIFETLNDVKVREFELSHTQKAETQITSDLV